MFSEVTRMELENAPPAVRAIVERVPQTHFVTLPVSERARELADAYIASGAVGPSHYNDALHVAIASVGGVDVIASWNLKHMASLSRIQAYNDVNRRFGYPMIDIRTPGEIYRDQ